MAAQTSEGWAAGRAGPRHGILWGMVRIGRRVLAEEDAIAWLDGERTDGAVVEELAVADGDDLALVGLLPGDVGDDAVLRPPVPLDLETICLRRREGGHPPPPRAESSAAPGRPGPAPVPAVRHPHAGGVSLLSAEARHRLKVLFLASCQNQQGLDP